MADPKKVKVFDGTDWVDLKADDPNLPISSTDNKVTLSDDGNGKFQIETGSTEESKAVRLQVTDAGVVKLCAQNDDINVGFNYLGSIYAEPGPSVGTGNLFLSGQFARGPYYKDMVEITHDYNLIVNYGQVQTNTITTKDDASGDATHTLSGKTQTFMSDKIELRTHYQLPTTNSNADGRPTWTPEIVPVCVGASAYKEPLTVMKTPGAADDHQSAILIYESSSQSGTGYSIDWIGAAGQLAHEDDLMDRRSASINVVRKATSGDWNMEFYVLDSTPGTSVEGVWRNPLTITAEGQLHASTDYEPNDDNSLVTKGWVTTNGASGTLPISSTDGTVKLDSPSANTFTVETGGNASISVDANAIIKSETGYVGLHSNQNGWDNRLNINGNTFNYSTGVVNQETKRYVKETDGTSTQVVKEGVYGLTTTVNDWGAQAGHSLFRNLVGPHVIQAEKHVRLITQTPNGDPNVTDPTAGIYLASSGTDLTAQLTTSQSGVVCVDTSVQLQTQAAPNSDRRTRLTVKDTEIVSEVVVKAPSVSGIAASDASISLGAELLTSNHTPTLPNSIATKAYVDASGGGSSLVPLGTPSDDTTPDSAPGSMLFDENYLWIRTDTVWKKLSLAAFNDNATSVTVQLTQSAFNAIASPDPNVLYVIVGD